MHREKHSRARVKVNHCGTVVDLSTLAKSKTVDDTAGIWPQRPS